MAHSRRIPAVPNVRRNRNGTAAQSPAIASAPVLLSREIVDAKPKPVVVSASFAEALVGSATTGPIHPGTITQVIVPHSTPELLAEIATTSDLHPLLVEDLFHADQRPKVDRYGDVLFVVLRAAVYVDAKEAVDFSEFHVLMKGDDVVIICQGGHFIDGAPIPEDIGQLKARFPGADLIGKTDEKLLALGPEALVYRLLDAVVDGYFPVVDGLQATTHLNRPTQALGNGATKYAIPDELRAYLNDVSDHLTRVLAEAGELRESLSQILSVNSTLVAQRQNEDMKKISGWAAILFDPSLIGAVYEMNFDHMPELHWAFGYPLAIVLMVGLSVTLYTVFRVKKWM